jgi:hypothetical protein
MLLIDGYDFLEKYNFCVPDTKREIQHDIDES